MKNVHPTTTLATSDPTIIFHAVAGIISAAMSNCQATIRQDKRQLGW